MNSRSLLRNFGVCTGGTGSHYNVIEYLVTMSEMYVLTLC